MAHNSIEEIINDTFTIIWKLFANIHMPFPTTYMFLKIAQDFETLWNFPYCMCCIDGKHIRIKCPKNTASMFFNYISYFSVHLQGICDANYKFIAIDVKAMVAFLQYVIFISIKRKTQLICQQKKKHFLTQHFPCHLYY